MSAIETPASPNNSQVATTPTAAVATTRASSISVTLDHPRLLQTDPESIRIFLRKYDQYSNEVISRARQLSSDSFSSSEPVRPVEVKFCVDPEYLESSIALGFIEGVTDYASLTDAHVRAFLDNRSAESKTVVTLEKLDEIVEKELRTNMRNTDATTRMQDLFASYYTILARHGLRWIVTDNQKVAVQHILSAVRPWSLKERLESDLSFSKYELRKDFKGFLAHSVKLAEAFQLVDSGSKRPKDRRNNNNKSSRSGNSKGTGSSERDSSCRGNTGTSDSSKRGDRTQNRGPICLWPSHKEKGIRHRIKDCPECPEEEKSKLLQEHLDSLKKDGPSRSTRSQAATTGRLQKGTIQHHSSPSCSILLYNRGGRISVEGTGRCDDGSDDSIASPKLAEKSVLKGIGSFEAIKPVTIQVALKADENAQSFQFSRKWLVPKLVLQLASGRMALKNVSFLVADDSLACEDILVGLPVLKHLGIDSRTMLERNRAVLDGTDCSSVEHPTIHDSCGSLGRLMIARLTEERVPGSNTDEREVPAGRSRSNYYMNRSQIDPFEDPNLVGVSDNKERKQKEASAINDMIQRAKDSGLPNDSWKMFEDIVRSFTNVFGIGFSSTPSKIDPLRIELLPEARPTRVKIRNYSHSQRVFMKKLMDELKSYGLIYDNPSSKWACAPLVVPKPGPAQWRFTVDLRPVNKYTAPYAYLMPNTEQELTKAKGSKVYCGVDFTMSYWQILLAEDSQECQSWVTPDGIKTPTRVPHGTTNAVLHLQSWLMKTLPPRLFERVLLWVDDCLFHARDVGELLDCLREFLQFCSDYNIMLHPEKCQLFTKEAHWCGRIINENGVRFNPKNIEGLTSMDTPQTGGQLQKFVCAMQWLRSSIPQFQELIAPLHNFMEEVYTSIGKRTKRSVASADLAKLGWTQTHSDAFERCKQAIIHRVVLAHRDEKKRLHIYTDASETHWSGIVTQVPADHLHLPHSEQHHDPLAFHSGRFNDTEKGWSTIEKEAFAIMATLDRVNWLASCPEGFDLYTDHNNLIFIFDPLAVMPDIGQAAVKKVLRWAVHLSRYNYDCFHIKGDENIWADLLSRWGIPHTIRRLISIPPLPTTFKEFEWPTAASIQQSQEKFISDRLSGLHFIDNLWKTAAGQVWIPDKDDDMQLRLAIIAHTGMGGHRGREATFSMINKHFTWSTIKDDINLFVKSCIHCTSTTGGETVPRPFGPAFYGTKPNDLLQFDYIDLGPSDTGDRYILMLRDDHSGYSWLYPSTDETAETASHALLDWCTAFGAPKSFMSDGPSHFKNETLRLLSKGLQVKHHFTLPYCPWSNGAIERLGKELIRIFRALLSEMQLRHNEWPQLLPIVTSIINNSPSPQRKNVAPITAFSGAPPKTPINTFIRSVDSVPLTFTKAQLERSVNMEKLASLMDELHPLVQSSLKNQRERIRESRSKGKPAQFDRGDYVLVARQDFDKGEKLCLRWRGPRRIVKALSDYVFQVEDLRNGLVEDIHGTRLKFYQDSSLNEQTILSHVLSSETGMPVSRLLRIEEGDDGQLYVVVRWKGLDSTEDTLEPLSRVFEDTPLLVKKLLQRKNIPTDLKNRAEEQLKM